MKPLKPIKIVRSKEKLSNRIGVPFLEEILRQKKIRQRIDKLFGKPGSNRGILASDYVTTLMYMYVDGALHLEDIIHLQEDEAFQELLEDMRLPTSDALGDWLRRYGGKESEEKMHQVIRTLLEAAPCGGSTLDIDATIIESTKGDAKRTYKGNYGYQPLLGIIAENGYVVGSEFREGNHSPQSGLVPFIDRCRATYPESIKLVRSDSAGWQKDLVDYCQTEGLHYTISTAQTEGILEALKAIPEEDWEQGRDANGIKAPYDVGETTYRFGGKKRTVRLVAKRTTVKKQNDLFLQNYRYWIVATNIPESEQTKHEVLRTHQNRGTMERRIGELKHQLQLNKVPCGQFNANSLYFTIGVFAYNLLQLLKQLTLPKEQQKKSIRGLRYQLLKLAGKLVHHARYIILQIAAPAKNVELFADVFAKLRYGLPDG